jgi:predicted amidophosphoribosyltransferase
MFVFWAIAVKNFVFDILFPRSERARRVESKKDMPIPASVHTRTYKHRTITILSSYDDRRVRDCVCALKFERDTHSLKLLAALLDDFLIEQIADAVLFGERVLCVPVPLGKKRLAERGMNQVEEVLKTTRAVYTEQVHMVHALERTRETVMQSTLPRAKRLENMRGAFGVVPTHEKVLRGTTILLIDDVTTTGATLYEAAMVLERAGAKVHAIALAG